MCTANRKIFGIYTYTILTSEESKLLTLLNKIIKTTMGYVPVLGIETYLNYSKEDAVK